MKQTSMIFLIPVLLFFANCGENNAVSSEQEAKKKEVSPSNSSAQGDDIVGEWEMVSSMVDTNDNLQIDDEERPKLKPVSFKDYMKLNRDGSGLFTIAKLEGRYEIKQNEDNGRNLMTWYDKTNSPHNIGSVMKVTKDELTIKEPGGSGLFLWKRL